MSKVFFPLRSNAGWFGSDETQSELESRLKLYSMFYDLVSVQDGRYTAMSGPNGQSQSFFPPGSWEGDRTKVTRGGAGAAFQVKVGENYQSLIDADACFVADFYPILHGAGLLDADFIELTDRDLNDEGKKYAQEHAGADFAEFERENKELSLSESFRLLQIFKSLYIDAYLATGLNVPFGVDAYALPAITHAFRSKRTQLMPDAPPLVFDYWLKIGLPDFRRLSWDEIRDMRDSDAGGDFRRMIQELKASVRAAMPNAGTPEELNEVVETHFVKEIVNELLARRQKPGQTVIGWALNFVPWGGLASAVVDANRLMRTGELGLTY